MKINSRVVKPLSTNEDKGKGISSKKSCTKVEVEEQMTKAGIKKCWCVSVVCCHNRKQQGLVGN